MVQIIERWPPVYDFEDLQAAISGLIEGDLAGQFWTSVRGDPPVCQGDVVAVDGGVPVLDENGEATVTGEFQHWMVIGNTCDFARRHEEVSWTQLVPIARFAGVEPADLLSLKRYALFRRFYVPDWSPDEDAVGVLIADLLRPVAIDKRALMNGERVVARMSRRGWILLHACLVRFLARDDGRNSP